MQDLPVGTDGVTVRLRVGAFPVVNTVLAVVFVPVFATLVLPTVGFLVQEHGWGRLGDVVGVFVSALALLAVLGWLGTSLSDLRPVLVITGPHGSVSLPYFDLRRGAYRRVLPLARITATLSYRSEARNGRWRLEIHHIGGEHLFSDSVTCSRGRDCDVRATPGARAARWLDTEARAARR